MQIAMNHGLALMRWPDSRFFQDFSSRDLAWMVIGALLTLVVFWVISRRRRRWF